MDFIEYLYGFRIAFVSVGVRKFMRFASITAAFMMSSFMVGCGSPATFFSNIAALRQTSVTPEDDGIADPEPTPQPSSIVCDALGGGSTPPPSMSSQAGLKGELRYIPPAAVANRPYSSIDFFLYGTKIPVDLFFSKIDVPTQSFTQGFRTQTGTLLKTPGDDLLMEYFLVRFQTRLKLGGAMNQPGNYQFATLSDDGSMVRIKDPDARVLVDNDGTHAPRFRCSEEAVSFTEETRLATEIDYFQGPAQHISMIMLWRARGEGDSLVDPVQDAECFGSADTERYFRYRDSAGNPIVPSEPKAAWLELLNKGWRVLEPENFLLPESETAGNPCL